ncbi:MAG: radical SAM family heme chaperone HemW [Chloroflexi bacterium]|nr:radical SAM family heme chaperone HemW [Chloroflexota bacterium]
MHIPFCTTKCTYCAFNTYANLEALIGPFVDALITELGVVGRSQPGTEVGTVFFGGGTPSLLTPGQFARILDGVHRHFAVRADAEITLEANPNDLNRAYLAQLRAVGLHRISIGMQSANSNELALFRRRHDNDATAHAVSAARAAGFDNLNLDLIYGVPHQTLFSWETSLQQMLALQPEHISLYALSVEDDTPMQSWVARGRLPEPDDDLAADMYDLATEMLAQAGHDQYEISNWARPGRQCQHNLQYWRNWPYVGVGPGAHGFAGGVRYATILSPHRYIKALETVTADYTFPLTPATDQHTRLTQEDEIAETLIMSLRLTQEGIDRAAFVARFGVDILDAHGPTLEKYAAQGLLTIDDQRVCITAQGRLLSNMIFRELV